MKQLKPRDKVTQHMTRDGLTLDNQTTGESINISSREAEQDYSAAEPGGTAEKVLRLTREVVAEHRITTLMVTHNMHQALELGNRTLMMDAGNIILDVQGEERSGLTVTDLLERFRAGAGKQLDNDRILLS